MLSTSFLGSSVAPLILVDIVPVVIPGLHPEHAVPSLSAPFVKFQLLRQTLRCNVTAPFVATATNNNTSSTNNNNCDLRICWDESDHAATTTNVLKKGQVYLSSTSESTKLPTWCFLESFSMKRKVPLVYFTAQDPTLLKPWPCMLLGYCAWRLPSHMVVSSSSVLVTDATLVRILPAQMAIPIKSIPCCSKPWSDHRARADQWRHSLIGVVDNCTVAPDLMNEVFINHDTDTVDELTLRMSTLLSKTILIGTTKDAFTQQQRWNQRRQSLQRVLNTRMGMVGKPTNKEEESYSQHSLLEEGSLIVHSPDHGAGKTLLVQSIARQKLHCKVHVIHPGPLIAKFGVQVDAAIESLLHSIIVGAAAQGKPVCIILDHMDAILPPTFSGKSGAGDAAVAALNGVASVLKKLSLTLKSRSEYPFPTQNSLYNLGGQGGMVLPVRICLVGIVTCPNNVGRSRQGDNRGLNTVLESMAGGRFLLPPLAAMTRVKAFQHSFDKYSIKLTTEAADRLLFISASAIWARGAAFQDVARQLRTILENKATDVNILTTQATGDDLERAISLVRSGATRPLSVSFTGERKKRLDQLGDTFENVGGNVKAKRALEDALALNPFVAQKLANFGLSPPSGILLYGPPGCGKTLLARSVANLLHSKHSTALGGAFFALSASTIVRAEVGTSEKIVTASFDTARINAPAVIFIDEFQALFTDRQGMGSGRLSSVLLQCMDDIKFWSEMDKQANAETDQPSEGNDAVIATRTGRILVLGATNTPWMVDKAFLRPGRFDRVVHVALPSLPERQAIFRAHIGRMRVAFSKKSGAEIERVCTNIAKKTNGFSGADLAALCRAAAVRCLKENQGSSGRVEERHLMEALDQGDVRASSSASLVERLNVWRPGH